MTGSYLAITSGESAVASMINYDFNAKLSRPVCRAAREPEAFSNSYSAGSSAVNDEQHGFSVAWKFINSSRIPSGS